jgi:hypothetical protein
MMRKCSISSLTLNRTTSKTLLKLKSSKVAEE